MGCTRISHALCYGIRVPFVTISHLPHPRGKVHSSPLLDDMGQFMGKKALSGSIGAVGIGLGQTRCCRRLYKRKHSKTGLIWLRLHRCAREPG